MASKFIVLSMLVASAYCSGGQSSFSYGVSDPNTGDVKDQHEQRVGDSVVGQYSLLESDGTKRVVEYEANPATGFNAVVRKEGGAAHLAGAGYANSGAYPGAYNSYANGLGGNLGYSNYPGNRLGSYGGYGAHGGPQGVPVVSQYSHSVQHDVSRGYGPYGGYNGAYGNGYNGAYSNGYNGAYGGAYNGAYNGAYGGYGAFGGAGFGAPFGQGYNGLTRGEAYPHGYGGYGARHGAGIGAGLGW